MTCGMEDEYGIDYYECAIRKLLQREGCEEPAPLFCNFDYVMAKQMHAELRRSKALVSGGDSCDFWYTKKSVKKEAAKIDNP